MVKLEAGHVYIGADLEYSGCQIVKKTLSFKWILFSKKAIIFPIKL